MSALRGTELQVFAAFTAVRAEVEGLAPWQVAKAIGIRTGQVHALYEGNGAAIGTRARDRLYAFHGIEPGSLAHGHFGLPSRGAETQAIAAKVCAYLPTKPGGDHGTP